MNRRLLVGASLAILVALMAVSVAIDRSVSVQTASHDTATTIAPKPARLEAVMYATQTCGCCHQYAKYLEENDVKVSIIHVSGEELLEKMSVAPKELYSCHLVTIEEYYVIGHVPFQVIQKLVTEKPQVLGISLPGMPPGSPGMGGEKQGPFTIYYFTGDEIGVYTTI